jgi:hypothetical protein
MAQVGLPTCAWRGRSNDKSHAQDDETPASTTLRTFGDPAMAEIMFCLPAERRPHCRRIGKMGWPRKLRDKPEKNSTTNVELGDERLVAGLILALQIVEKRTTL